MVVEHESEPIKMKGKKLGPMVDIRENNEKIDAKN